MENRAYLLAWEEEIEKPYHNWSISCSNSFKLQTPLVHRKFLER